jgi:ribose/xylose/arabinose/galactoside ABC-type transport system permease subunit
MSSASTAFGGSTRRAALRRWVSGGGLQESGVWIALAALVLFDIAATNHFLTAQTLRTNLSQMSAVAIAAIGMTLIMATGGIDLSVGSLMSLAGAASGYLLLTGAPVFKIPALGTLLVVGFGLLVAGSCGLLNGFFVGRLGIQPIVATLVLQIVGRGVAQLTTSGRLFVVSDPDIIWLGRGSILGITAQAWLMLLVLVAATWLTRATVFGRYVVAVGGNERSAALAGVNVRRVKYAVYALGGVLAGLTGLLNVGINGTVDTANLGLGWEFTVISAVVVGGTPLTGGRPRLMGTLGGVALIQLLAFTLASHNVSKEAANLVQAAVIILAVLLQLKKRS